MKKEIYLGGGCFWGLEEYLARLDGVLETEAGYANGRGHAVTYEQVCSGATGHAETVRVCYDTVRLPLVRLLELYFKAIDPVSVNRQGADIGSQYRTGIYYNDEADEAVAKSVIAGQQEKYRERIAVEVKALENYCRAEEYHQRYLQKNPGGYCHIPVNRLVAEAAVRVDAGRYIKPSKSVLRQSLSGVQYNVTQLGGTEAPFTGAYDDFYEDGLYVDAVTGEPLFTSRAKYFAGCGWPSFTEPVVPEVVTTHRDRGHGMERVEVRSRVGGSHLGHVFGDGPPESGGLRYCINSAALRFIPLKDMDMCGYGEFKALVR